MIRTERMLRVCIQQDQRKNQERGSASWWCVSLHERRETRLPAVLTVAAAAAAAAAMTAAAVALSFSLPSRDTERGNKKSKNETKQNQKKSRSELTRVCG